MELSFYELVLVALIAFLVLGPKELIIKSQALGRFVGRLRTQWENIKIMAQEEIRIQEKQESKKD
jgi:Sec-independent protein translocase protein TatA